MTKQDSATLKKRPRPAARAKETLAHELRELASPEEWLRAFYDWARTHPGAPAKRRDFSKLCLSA